MIPIPIGVLTMERGTGNFWFDVFLLVLYVLTLTWGFYQFFGLPWKWFQTPERIHGYTREQIEEMNREAEWVVRTSYPPSFSNLTVEAAEGKPPRCCQECIRTTDTDAPVPVEADRRSCPM